MAAEQKLPSSHHACLLAIQSCCALPWLCQFNSKVCRMKVATWIVCARTVRHALVCWPSRNRPKQALLECILLKWLVHCLQIPARYHFQCQKRRDPSSWTDNSASRTSARHFLRVIMKSYTQGSCARIFKSWFIVEPWHPWSLHCADSQLWSPVSSMNRIHLER